MFWKKRTRNAITGPANKQVWAALRNIWNRCKILFADYLTKKTAQLSPSKLRLLLYIFLLLCTGISICIILSPFINDTDTVAWQKKGIQTPINVYEREKAVRYADSAVSYKNYRRIEKFEKYLDSLCTTDAGKHKYDSLIKLHPGLIDSLMRLKGIYHSQ